MDGNISTEIESPKPKFFYLFICLFVYLFIYLWLHWVFIAERRLLIAVASLVAEHRL